MQKRQRYLLIGLSLGFLLPLGLVFQNFLLTEVVLPLATVVWLLLRIFVLSIDQQVYWWALIFLVVIVTLVRLLHEPAPGQAESPPEENPGLHQVLRWQATITNNLYETSAGNSLKQGLRWLLINLYTPRRQNRGDLATEMALRQGRIPVPAGVYAFLLAGEPAVAGASFFRHPVAYGQARLRAAQSRFQSWLRRVTGREAAAYYQAIDEVLTLMENALEMPHDDEPTTTLH